MCFAGGGRIAESAKARARRASLLKNEDFRLLADQTTVGGIAAQMGQTAYAAVLKGFPLETVRRGDLEFLLWVSILGEGVAFLHYADLRDRNLLNLWLESFDAELLKNRLRSGREGAKNGEGLSADRMIELVSDFKLTLADQEKLFASDSLRDTLAAVKKPALRAALLQALPSAREDIAAGENSQKMVFLMGMTLDRAYFDSLYGAVAGLGGDEGRLLRLLVGTRVDLMNLYWIYRARRFFGLSPEESLTLVMKSRYRADFELLTKAAFAEPRALAAVLEGTPYAQVFCAEDAPAKDPEAERGDENAALREIGLEHRVYGYLLAATERVFLAGSAGFQNVAAYLTLKELEVRDIIAVVEAVRYGLSKDMIDRVLIRSLGKGE
jgi:V/A-type H+-transporting ATPase subunit C